MPQQQKYDLTDLGATKRYDLSDLGAKRVSPSAKPTISQALIEAHKELGRQVLGIPKGFAKTAAGLIRLPFQIAAPPAPDEEMLTLVGGPLAVAAKRLTWDPQAAEFEAARSAAEQGKTAESMWHSATAGIPLAGPVIAQLGGLVAEGKPGEAVGTGLGMWLTGKAAGRLITRTAIPKKGYITPRDLTTENLGMPVESYRQIIDAIDPNIRDTRIERGLGTSSSYIVEEARNVVMEMEAAKTGRTVAQMTPGGRVAAMRKAEANPVPTVADYVGLQRRAFKRIAQIREQFLAPIRDYVQFTGDALTDKVNALLGSKPYMRMVDKGGTKTLRALAEENRGKIYTLAEAERMLEEVNGRMTNYHAMSKADQALETHRSGFLRDNTMAEFLRDQMYSKIDALMGPGFAEIQRAYGYMKDVNRLTEPLALDILRYGGKNFIGLTAEAAADALAGSIYSTSGGVIRGVRGAVRIIRKGQDQKIAAAFKRMSGMRPRPIAPTPPEIAGELPHGAIPTGPPPDPSFVKGFSAPYGDVATQVAQRFRPERTLPATGETTPVEFYATQTPGARTKPKLLTAGPPAPEIPWDRRATGAPMPPATTPSYARGVPAVGGQETGTRMLPPAVEGMVTPPPGGYSGGFVPPQVGGYRSAAPAEVTPTPPSVVAGGKGIQVPIDKVTQLVQQVQKGWLDVSDIIALRNAKFITPAQAKAVLKKLTSAASPTGPPPTAP